MSSWNHLPVALPHGALMPHMSGRLRAQAMDAVFEMTGGIERLAAFANESNENYETFIKLWARGAIRPSSVEIESVDGIEELLRKLDAGEHAQVVESEVIDG